MEDHIDTPDVAEEFSFRPAQEVFNDQKEELEFEAMIAENADSGDMWDDGNMADTGDQYTDPFGGEEGLRGSDEWERLNQSAAPSPVSKFALGFDEGGVEENNTGSDIFGDAFNHSNDSIFEDSAHTLNLERKDFIVETRALEQKERVKDIMSSKRKPACKLAQARQLRLENMTPSRKRTAKEAVLVNALTDVHKDVSSLIKNLSRQPLRRGQVAPKGVKSKPKAVQSTEKTINDENSAPQQNINGKVFKFDETKSKADVTVELERARKESQESEMIKFKARRRSSIANAVPTSDMCCRCLGRRPIRHCVQCDDVFCEECTNAVHQGRLAKHKLRMCIYSDPKGDAQAHPTRAGTPNRAARPSHAFGSTTPRTSPMQYSRRQSATFA